jgi:hypothetical protein
VEAGLVVERTRAEVKIEVSNGNHPTFRGMKPQRYGFCTLLPRMSLQSVCINNQVDWLSSSHRRNDASLAANNAGLEDWLAVGPAADL